jgi:acetyl-CoA carboxylase biotin carboxyl carrier protein
MSLTFADVQEILRIIDQTSTSELHIEVDDFKLIVSRHGAGTATMHAPAIMASDAKSESTSSTPLESSTQAPTDAAPSATAVALRSPLAGTFYRAPSPDAEPFVEVGDRVTKGATVCILDVMKVMNMLTAPCDSRVCAINVIDAEAISGGQQLIWFEPD